MDTFIESANELYAEIAATVALAWTAFLRFRQKRDLEQKASELFYRYRATAENAYDRVASGLNEHLQQDHS